jgi:adenine-specific DNA-methyltransferase
MPTLDWIGKKAVEAHHKDVPFHLLRQNDVLTVGESGSGNLLVQGDNLLALKALLPYYAGQVKCIYIDPPYNTGNENWVYNDNVNSAEIREWLGKVVGKDAEDLSRHDKWLCMMYPRLQLLKEFLREDGAIFISIDDNEVENLKLICNEIFGEQNFYGTIVWQKKDTPSNDAKGLSITHEYVVVYVRSSAFVRRLVQRTEAQLSVYKNPDNDPRGVWTRGALTRKEFVEKDYYPIKNPHGREVLPPPGTSWRVSKTTLAQLIAENRLWWGKSENGNMPFAKRFLSEVQSGVVPISWWDYKFAGSTRNAKMEIRALFNNTTPFETAKPITLIKRLLSISTSGNDLILDSFAGSGTTGHAVLALNKEDGGNRRFVLVEMDKNICRNITAQRLSRVVNGYTAEKQGGKQEQIPALGGGFRFCELGETLFAADGTIREAVTFDDLARHVFFVTTGEPLPENKKAHTPLIGAAKGVGVYLLYNGILRDKSPQDGNVLTNALLSSLPPHDGAKIIYGTSCRVSAERLRRDGATFRQIPYELRIG